MVNEGNGKGRSNGNVVKVRALFVDLDGAPLEPVLASEFVPHMIIESSPGRYHVYWLVCDCPLERFKSVQLRIALRFYGDKGVNDLCRVMRLPGFVHNKDLNKPFTSRLQNVQDIFPTR